MLCFSFSRSLNKRGLGGTRKKWETHWANAVTDNDLTWLSETAHCNNIRLPIGYYTLGPAFCANTAFAMQPSEVYVNAWAAVKSIISRCFARGIGVLIDLHGVPGGANHETHSGTSSGKAELWGNQFNLNLATRCIQFIADESIRDPQLAGVVGIQICNESIIDPPGMYEWYNDVIQLVSVMDASMPLYISDGWELGRATRFTRAYNTVDGPPKTPVVVDCHKYWTFDEKDTSRSPYEIIEQVKTELPELDSSLMGDVFSHRAGIAVYIGEYSQALAPQTWSRAPADQKDNLMKDFGNEQSKTWQRKASGSAFWTFKMEWMPGWEWGFKAGTDNGQILSPKSFKFTVREVKEKLILADNKRSEYLQANLEGHSRWWDTTNPGRPFEHWRYSDGYFLGWNDARDFFAARLGGVIPSSIPYANLVSSNQPPPPPMGGFDGANQSQHWQSGGGQSSLDENKIIGADTIGAIDLWVLKRMRESRVADSNTCPFGWEWEHGFRAGERGFREVVGA